jgi:hypothetical protein
MSILDRLLGRGRAAHVTAKVFQMSPEEAGTKRAALWQEIRAGPTPERAAEIANEATALLDHYGREHALRYNVLELIEQAEKQAGKVRIVTRL